MGQRHINKPKKGGQWMRTLCDYDIGHQNQSWHHTEHILRRNIQQNQEGPLGKHQVENKIQVEFSSVLTEAVSEKTILDYLFTT